MREWRTSIEIAAPAAEVFRYLVEPELGPRWVPGLIRSDVVEGVSGTEGAVMRSTHRLNRREFDVLSRDVEVKPPRLVVTEHTSPGGSWIQRMNLSESDRGTRLEMAMSPVLVPRRQRILLALMPETMESQGKLAAERLKAVVENPGQTLDSIEVVRVPARRIFALSVLAGIVLVFVVRLVQSILTG